MLGKVLEILTQFDGVNNVKKVDLQDSWDSTFYKYVFKFNMDIDRKDVGMVMSIPIDWERNLIDIFIEEYSEFQYIPHVSNEGKLCLYDLEGIIINVNFEGLIYESLKRAKKILYDGINKRNLLDFINEFESYWQQLNEIGSLKSEVKPEDNIKKIKYTIDSNNSNENIKVSAADSENKLKKDKTIKNGIYINIKANNYIYPPDSRKHLDISYINNILKSNCIRRREVEKKIKFNSELLVYININQPNAVTTTIAVFIENYNKHLVIDKEYFQLNINCKCTPLRVYRLDTEYLLKRGGIFTNKEDKKILVVGCGSIGSYFISEIIKTGISNVSIVDDDVLTIDNIYRHLLGLEYVGYYKTEATVNYLNKNIPNLNLFSYVDTIENVVKNGEIDLAYFDLIISATGNHNVNRWINKYIKNEEIETPVIYLWNEALGIGNHALFVESLKPGCFECLIDEDENGVYVRTTYCKRGQIFTKNYNGCHSTFLPFGSIHSIKTVCMGVELVLDYFNDKLKENVLISQKGDDSYIKNENLLTSDRYNRQQESIIKITGSIFERNTCYLCNGKVK